MNKFFVSEQEKKERVYINLYKAFRVCKDFNETKNDFIKALLDFDFIPFEDVLIFGSGDSRLIFKALEKCDHVYIQGKKFLSSEEFKKYSDVEKIIILLNQPDKWRQGFTKENYLDLVKDWPPILKSIEFNFVFEKPEVCADFNMADLKLMEINDWPDEIKLKSIKLLAENNKNNNLSDINNADELEKNEIFITSSPELKYLFIKKLLHNNIKNLGQKDNYLESDIQDMINVAKKNLDFRFLSVLSADIYNNYGIDIDFGDEIIKFYNENSDNSCSFDSLKKLSTYNKLNGNEKLRCLQLCDIEDSILDEFDKILPEIDLNDFANKEYFLPMFFKKVAKFNPAALTPAFISQKSNWPIEIKRCAFQALPDFFRTSKNFNVIFLPEEIKYLTSQNYDQQNIKQKIKDYVYALKPDFEFDEKNTAKFNKLVEIINRIDLAKIKKALDGIYKAMEYLTLEQIKIYINKIKNEIEKSEEKAQALANYLLGDKKEKLPDYFKNDIYVEKFIEYSHDFVKKFERDKDFLRIFLGTVPLLIGISLIVFIIFLGYLLFSVPLFFQSWMVPFGLSLAPFLSFICFAGVYGILSSDSKEIFKNSFAFKDKQVKQLEKISEQIKTRYPELNKTIKNLYDEVKNDKSLSVELGQRIKKESKEREISGNKKNTKDMSNQTDENKKLDSKPDENNKNKGNDKEILGDKIKLDNESKTEDKSAQTDENKKLDNAIVEKNNADTKVIDKNNRDGKKIKDSEIKNDGNKNDKEKFVEEEVVVLEKTEYQVKKEEIKISKIMGKNVVNKVNQNKDEKEVNEKQNINME